MSSKPRRSGSQRKRSRDFVSNSISLPSASPNPAAELARPRGAAGPILVVPLSRCKPPAIPGRGGRGGPEPAAVAVILAVTTTEIGGDGWESNPPRTPQQRPANGFEDRGGHQPPIIPSTG